jgi:hypothetical protein
MAKTTPAGQISRELLDENITLYSTTVKDPYTVTLEIEVAKAAVLIVSADFSASQNMRCVAVCVEHCIEYKRARRLMRVLFRVRCVW